MNPTKLANKGWEDPYKLNRALYQQHNNRHFKPDKLFGGIPSNLGAAFATRTQ